MKRLSPRSLCAALCAALCLALAAACLPALAQQTLLPVKITLPQKQTLYVGRSLQLTPQTTPEGASATFTWKSGNPAVATVEDGLVTGVSAGKAKITAVTPQGKKASCTVTVKPVPVEGFEVQAEESAGLDALEQGLLTGHTLRLSPVSLVPADAQPAFSWKSSKTGVASVNKQGLVTGKKAGVTTLTITAKYGKASRSLSLHVVQNQRAISKDKFESAMAAVYPAPIPGAGIQPYAKKVYVKNGSLMADMYMYNADASAIGGKIRMSVFFHLNASAAQFTDYQFLGNYTCSIKRTKPGEFSVCTLKLGNLKDLLGMDQTQVVLLDAMAFGQAPMDGEAAKSAAAPLVLQALQRLTR